MSVQVLHRLALGVEPIDMVTRQRLGSQIRVGRELPVAPRPTVLDPGLAWPCDSLEYNGTGKFKLRHGHSVTDHVAVRVDDPSRRFVPRRFAVALWTLAEVSAAGPYVPVLSRVLRPWLLPGSAYHVSRGTTGIRGRIVLGGQPVRWPRVTALGPGGSQVGWAHGDERGEFLLLVNGTGTLPPPAPSSLDVDLVVSAPDPAHPEPVDSIDRCADLVVEVVTRSSAPPAPGDLDNDLLRGLSTPAGYLTSTALRPHLAVPIGEVLTIPQDVVFTP
jgi:hypothetical protein